MTSIKITYFAALREARGLAEETFETKALTAKALLHELKEKHHWSLSEKTIRVAINDYFQSANTPLKDGDRVVFVPPVSGG
jgi:molybdopterin converting factor subunit 1